MRRRRYLIFLICAILPLISGCTHHSGQPGTTEAVEPAKPVKPAGVNKADQKKKPIIACIVNQDDEYMKLLQLGMSDAAAKAGANVILANTYGKLDREIELINTYIKSGIDGICIHPVSVDLSVPILKNAKEGGIKVISAGISIEDKYSIPYNESDQWELGKKTGEACRDFIQKNLNGSANIAVINYKSQFPEESTKRTDGFKSEVTALPGAKIVTEKEAWLTDTAIAQAQSIIASQPGLNVIWAANEGGTAGSAIAVKNSGEAGKIFVFGTDVSEQLLNMLIDDDDILQMVTAQQPYFIGYQAMEQLLNDLKGEHANGTTVIAGIPLSRENRDAVEKYIADFKKTIGAK